MHAAEPDLLDPLRLLGLPLVPQDRREALALLVERHRVAGVSDRQVQRAIGKLEGVKDTVDELRRANRQTDGIHRVPDTHECDRPAVRIVEFGHAHREAAAQLGDALRRQLAGLMKQAREPAVVQLPVLIVGLVDGAVEVVVGPVLRQIEDAAGVNQAGQRAHGERAAAETEKKDLVARRVDARQLAIELLDVAAESPAGRAGQQRRPFDRFGPDAVVIHRHLRHDLRVEAMAGLIDRFVDFENVGAAALDCGVAGAVGADGDVFNGYSTLMVTSAGVRSSPSCAKARITYVPGCGNVALTADLPSATFA